MRKYLFTIPAMLFCLNIFGQSVSFADLRQLTHKKDVNAFLTGKAIGFVKIDSFVPVDTYIKNFYHPLYLIQLH
jgi:hypothetical protein